jgi:hypothetical protein
VSGNGGTIKDWWLFRLFGAGLLLLFAAQIFAGISHRPIVGDAGYLIFKMLEFGEFGIRLEHRYSTDLLTLPSYLAMTSGFSIPVIVSLWELVLTIYPIASVIGCLLYLYRIRRLELFIFPALSYAMTSQITGPFNYQQLNELYALFWPVLLYVVTIKRPTWAGSLVMFFLLFVLGLTHEGAILFFPIIIFSSWTVFRTSGQRFHLFIIVMSLLGMLSCFYRQAQYAHNNNFTRIDFRWSDPFPLICLISCVLIFTLILLELRGKKDSIVARLIRPVILVLPLSYLLIPTTPKIFLAEVYRIYSIPIVGVLATIMLISKGRDPKKWILQTTILFLFVASYHDLQITRSWLKSYAWMRQELSDHSWCHTIPREEYRKHLLPAGIFEKYVNIVSLMIQPPQSPMGILYSQGELPSQDPCKSLREGYLSFPQPTEPVKLAKPGKFAGLFEFGFLE